MPITLNGDGTVGGVTDFTDVDGGDFVATSVETTGNLLVHEVSANRYTLRVDETNNTVGINTSSAPAAGTFLQIADATDPIVSLSNTAGPAEVRLGCTATAGYIGTESSHPFNIETNSTTQVTVLTNGNVGVGTTNPAAPLEVSTSSADYRIQLSHILGQNFIKSFGTDQATYRNLGYDAAQHIWNIAGTTKMIINTAGNVGIGTTTPTARLHVVNSDSAEETPVRIRNFFFDGTNNSSASLRFEMSTASNQGGTAVLQGVCGTDAGGTNTDNDGGLRILVSSGGGGALSEAATFTKLGNLAFPNGQGIDFSASEGASASSSILDDYEEGVWVPTLVVRVNGSGNYVATDVTYDVLYTGGWYTKVGNVVHCGGALRLTNKGTVGDNDYLAIGGFPFAAVPSAIPYGEQRSGLALAQSVDITSTAGENLTGSCPTQGNSYGVLWWSDYPNTTNTSLRGEDVGDAMYITSFGGTYRTL